MKLLQRYTLFAALLLGADTGASSQDQLQPAKIEPLAIGNLSLPPSQRPRGQFSFGQTVVQKHDLLIFAFANSLKKCNRRLTDFSPILLYGVTDSFSLSITPSIALKFKKNGCCSRGIEDLFVQGEYIFVRRKTAHSSNGGAVVVGVTFPTGSAQKQPPTGLGSPSVFVGAGFGHLSPNWYFFIQNGVLLTTHHHGKKFGNRFLYQTGVGHNIKSPKGWIYSAIIEFLGTESAPDTVCGIRDCSTGGNVIAIAPSFWASSERFIFQAGISIPAYQRRPLSANNDRYYVSGGIAWKY